MTKCRLERNHILPLQFTPAAIINVVVERKVWGNVIKSGVLAEKRLFFNLI